MADDSLSDEDKALFREQMRTVTPLKKFTPKNTEQPTRPPAKIRRKESESVDYTSSYHLSDFISNAVHSDDVLSYTRGSIPAKRFKALKNGQIPWQARLDLHGLHAEAAKEALCRFIKIQTEANNRCVLIIHGKGGHEGAPPVIKNLVNRWLPQMDEILAFHSALAKDGGRGALYVFLKKGN